MATLLQQLKNRRLSLGLKQNDMMLRVGISRQQYQRLESKGNPRLDTLELIAKGLDSEMLLIPKEKLAVVQAVLDAKEAENPIELAKQQNVDRVNEPAISSSAALSDDPWQGLLGDEE